MVLILVFTWFNGHKFSLLVQLLIFRRFFDFPSFRHCPCEGSNEEVAGHVSALIVCRNQRSCSVQGEHSSQGLLDLTMRRTLLVLLTHQTISSCWSVSKQDMFFPGHSFQLRASTKGMEEQGPRQHVHDARCPSCQLPRTFDCRTLFPFHVVFFRIELHVSCKRCWLCSLTSKWLLVEGSFIPLEFLLKHLPFFGVPKGHHFRLVGLRGCWLF